MTNLVVSSLMPPTSSLSWEQRSRHRSTQLFHQYSSRHDITHQGKLTPRVCRNKTRVQRMAEPRASRHIANRNGTAECHAWQYKMPQPWSMSLSSQGHIPTSDQQLRSNRPERPQTKQVKALRVVGSEPTVWDSNPARLIHPIVRQRRTPPYLQSQNYRHTLHRSLWHGGVLRRL